MLYNDKSRVKYDSMITRRLMLGPMRCLGTLDMQLRGRSDFLFGLTCPNPLAPCISLHDLDPIGAIFRLQPRPATSGLQRHIEGCTPDQTDLCCRVDQEEYCCYFRMNRLMNHREKTPFK